MNKLQKNIVTWIVIWAGLLIVVLYSPLGSPDLYSPHNYYVDNQSVSVKSGRIINSPKGISSSENAGNGSDIPVITTRSGSDDIDGNYQSPNSTFRGASYTAQQSLYQNTNQSSTDASVGAGISIINAGGSRSSNGTSGIATTNGLASLSSTDQSTGNTIAKQSSPQGLPISGGTDPGGDPTGNPIPVGDGWWALLLYGGIYIVYKRRFDFFRIH